ncbi:MAG: BtpA/SgcQ family protein [Planctomycetota bacterium]
MPEETNVPAWSAMLGRGHAVVGMVHLGALPGSPGATLPVGEICEQAAREAKVLGDAGIDAIIVENMHDVPYLHGDRLGPEATACMTAAIIEVVSSVSCPVGAQILSGGNRQAIASCLAGGGGFIRCENFVFSHVADEGLLPEAEAGMLLRYRRSIGADRIGVFCDVKKKHASHAITGDLSIAEAAAGAAFFGADALIVTGSHTGERTSTDDVAEAAKAGLPVLVGSGADAGSLASLFEHANAVIVGSALKRDGRWQNPVDPARVDAMIAERDRLRRS